MALNENIMIRLMADTSNYTTKMAAASKQAGQFGSALEKPMTTGERFAAGATKAGVYELARYMAAALAPHHIRVNAISPGYVWSGIFDCRITEEGHDVMLETVPMKRFGTNDEIVSAVLFLASDASSYVTGTNLQIDGGYSVY